MLYTAVTALPGPVTALPASVNIQTAAMTALPAAALYPAVTALPDEVGGSLAWSVVGGH